MERKWIVGWKKFSGDPDTEWTFTLDYVDEDVPGALRIGEPYADTERTILSFASHVLNDETAALLSALDFVE